MPFHTRIPMLGRTFGRWTVVSGPYERHWEVQCSCGHRRKVAGHSLRAGKSTKCDSCAYTTHGLSRSGAYASWLAMMHRCHLSPGCESWEDYGGRGITVCERWHSFPEFYADMGDRPEGLEIDRIRNHEGYYPGNCRWATPTENSRNKRNTRLVQYGDRMVSLAEASELSGIHYATLTSRLRRGGDMYGPVKQSNNPRYKNYTKGKS